MKRPASSMVRPSSRLRLSRCTTPVSHTTWWNSTWPLTVTSNSHWAADVRTTTSTSSPDARTALMISMQRDAWPKACPEM